MRWSVVEPTWLPNPCQESQLVRKWEARRPSRRKSWLLGRKNPILITKKLNCNNHKTFSNNQSLKGDGLGTTNYLEADKPSSLVNSSDQTLTLDERTRNRPKWDKNDPKTISSIHFLPNSIESFLGAKQTVLIRTKQNKANEVFYNLSVMSGLGVLDRYSDYFRNFA